MFAGNEPLYRGSGPEVFAGTRRASLEQPHRAKAERSKTTLRPRESPDSDLDWGSGFINLAIDRLFRSVTVKIATAEGWRADDQLRRLRAQDQRSDLHPGSGHGERPGPVEVQGQGLTVSGVGLTGHPNERNFTLLSQTNTVVVLKNSSDSKSGKS